MKWGGSEQAKEDISSCEQAVSCGNHHCWVGVRSWCGFGNLLEAFVEETWIEAAEERNWGDPESQLVQVAGYSGWTRCALSLFWFSLDLQNRTWQSTQWGGCSDCVHVPSHVWGTGREVPGSIWQSRSEPLCSSRTTSCKGRTAFQKGRALRTRKLLRKLN